MKRDDNFSAPVAVADAAFAPESSAAAVGFGE